MHTFERNVADAINGRSVRVRYFEVKGKHAFDLLRDGDSYDDSDDSPLRDAPKPVTLADEVRGTTVDAVCEDIRSPHELLALLRRGRRRRATAATDVNGGSSRSHAVCRLDFDEEGGSLTLVDCAGSERSQDSLYHDKQRIKESVEINESLYALKRCIRASRAVRRWKARSARTESSASDEASPSGAF